MNLVYILIGTLAAGVGSVWIAAALSFGVLARYTQHMLSLAAGALLATAFLKLLPEAFESGVETHALSMTLLGGLVFFFLLDKAELWHHGHERHEDLPTLDEAMSASVAEGADAHAAAAGHDHARSHTHVHHHHHHHGGNWAVLAGDSVHCFGDGVIIASAFVASPPLGVAAALAVLVHEVPHHMGDLAVLRSGHGGDRRTALTKVSLAGAVTALGGVVGYLLLGRLTGLLPYLLMLASSSFIYVALADLIPQLQQRLNARETAAQILWLAIGMGLVALMGALGGEHAHHDEPPALQSSLHREQH
ncbi:ZIP family metal transporter [Ottowia sp.]|uniref:ZIP family metal transporter n=1 Tax=Ottowia sp. TaxID=1898956 RepID=UPI002CD68BBC|nr:ZIP family metal transporter [Ottowia sp.]HRN74412.1 ZIP family metal transporter [Ottowia sp.]HRQ01228.1 ZIP family metal transporter [Ottowia sp.]